MARRGRSCQPGQLTLLIVSGVANPMVRLEGGGIVREAR